MCRCCSKQQQHILPDLVVFFFLKPFISFFFSHLQRRNEKNSGLEKQSTQEKNRISFLIAFHTEGFYLSLMRVCWKFNPCFFPLSLLFISKHLRAFDFPFEKYRHITKQTQIPFDALRALWMAKRREWKIIGL